MKTIMATLLGAALLPAAGSLFVTPARAEVQYPWCAQYGGGRNGMDATNCGFVTLEQCRATISGIGGYCYENPMYPGAAQRPPRTRR